MTATSATGRSRAGGSLFAGLAGRIMLLSGWRRALVAVLAGALAALALAPVDFPFAGFLAFPVLVWLIDGIGRDPDAGLVGRVLPPFLLGWCFGFGYFLAGLWWLGAAFLVDAGSFAVFMPLAVVGLPLLLALFTGAGVALARLGWSDSGWRILALVAGLGLAEWARGIVLTGFPWNEFGLMAASHPILMQSASLVGIHGLTLLAVLVFSAPAVLIDRRGRWPVLALAALLAVAHIGFGVWRLGAFETEIDRTVAVRIVQPNIAQSLKWDPAQADRNFERLMELTVLRDRPALPAGLEEGEGEGEPPARTLIIWPESAFPFVLTDRPDAIARLGDTLQPGETLIAGATRVERSEAGRTRVYNSIYVIEEDGTIADARDKVHLVPFGEYLPFQDRLEDLGLMNLARMPGGFSPGAERAVTPLEGAPAFLPLICYEIIFPGEIAVKDPAPGFILNVTNDGWYGMTPGPYQHLRASQATAVALGLPMVRAANTGISVVTDAYGRELAGLGLGATGTIAAHLPAGGTATAYREHRDLAFWCALALAAAVSLASRLTLRPSID